MEILLIASLSVVIYVCCVYPLILVILSGVFKNPIQKKDFYPLMSIFVYARDDKARIMEKVHHLCHLDYPRDKMEIIVGSDGATNETYRTVKKFADENDIRYAFSFQEIGKSAMLNKLAKDARGEIYVVLDVEHRLERDTLKEIVRCFADEDVGAVSGDLVVEDETLKSRPRHLDVYWRCEHFLRKAETSLDSALMPAGGIYAFRHEIFRYLPQHLILDELYVMMNAMDLKKRAVFEPLVRVYTGSLPEVGSEFKERRDNFVGMFQIFSIFPGVFNPFVSRVAFQFFSHKFLGSVLCLFLVSAFVSNIVVAFGGHPVYLVTLLAQIFFYGLGCFGAVWKKAHPSHHRPSLILALPYEFCYVNLAAFKGMLRYVAGGQNIRLKDWVS